MDVIYPCCAGLDVHKQTVVACRVAHSPTGERLSEVRTFGTMTGDILALGEWLQSSNVTVFSPPQAPLL